MPQIFYAPQFQALSNQGLPLPNARLHFFATGTTNAAEVYADAARTTALSHPLVADSQGRFPAIYPDPDRVYRVRLSDSSGVQQWEEEGVSLQMFMRTKREMDAGIVPRNYAYPPGDVRRYGADPTGGKNSSEAFRQATQSTHSVYIPEGIFLVSEVVSATGTVMWRGEGAKSVIRSDSTVLIVTNGTGSMIDNIYLENITPPLIIKRNPENWTAPPILARTNDLGYAPTRTDEDIWNTLTKAEQDERIGPMIQFDGIASNVTVSRIYGRFVVIYLKGCTRSVVRDCNFRAGKNFGGIFIDNTHTGLPFPTTGQNKVLNNIVEYCSSSGICFMNNLDSEARGNTCSFNGEAGIKTSQGAGMSCARMLIADNMAISNYYGGIDAASRFPLETSQNLFHTIVNNSCINNREAGIGFDGNFVNVAGNMCYLNQWEGIFGAGANSSIVGNFCAGNARLSGHNEILVGASNNTCVDNHIHVHESSGYAIWSISDNVIHSNYATGRGFFLGEPVVNKTNLNHGGSGSSTFSLPPLTLGDYRLWVDANGRLRIKNGAPASDTDGVVVGAQS